jgi:FKBP-type peptidyl-prolyl cis-trans isomerase
MKRVLMAVAGLSVLTAWSIAQEPDILKNDKDKVNYGLGVGVARNFQRQGVDVDLDMVMRGMRDTLEGKKLLMTEEELQKVMSAFQKYLMQKQAEAAKLAGEKNLKEGAPFLAANKEKEGVVTLPSGLQYKILKEGDGKKPTINDTVVCNYRGTLIDGTEFDSSYKRNQPATFPLKSVIKGWSEALQLMPIGSRWQLFIPPSLAYGDHGAGPEIGPNATLIFEVELLAIK